MKSAKLTKTLAAGVAVIGILAALPNTFAEDKPAAKVKPYPLKTCLVSGEKLGEMGTPYVFTNATREIKLCCKGCLSDFQKTPVKYIKKLEEAEKKAAEKPAPAPAEDHSQHMHMH